MVRGLLIQVIRIKSLSKKLTVWRAALDGCSCNIMSWPNNVGLELPAHTMVTCTTNGAVEGTSLLGYVQNSHSIRGIWHYSVALAQVKNLRTSWSLVENVNPSQLIPVGMSEAAPGFMLKSTARIASSSFLYKPQQALNGPSCVIGGFVVPDISLSRTPEAEQPVAGCKQQVKEPEKVRALTTKQAQKPAASASVCVQMGSHRYKICIHNRRETACILCKGGSICVHNRQRYWCKECGGKAWCQHGKQKSRCVNCGGKGICQHGKLVARCQECTNGKP